MNLAFELKRDKFSCENNSFQPYKIVSLWDVLRFYAEWFIEVSAALARLSSGYQETIHHYGGKADIDLNPLIETLRRFIPILTAMDLRMSVMTAERLLNCVTSQKDKKDFQKQAKLTDELLERVIDEFKGQLIVRIPYDKAEYFNGKLDILDVTTRDAFPSAEYDIVEANKCFSLERYTACVFHAMRALEAGLFALGAALMVPVADNWNKALDMIEKEIRSRNAQTHGATWKINDEPFYTEAATHFRMVKNAWRNHTMHLKEHYDEERAHVILSSVSNFMKHLATKLHE